MLLRVWGAGVPGFDPTCTSPEESLMCSSGKSEPSISSTNFVSLKLSTSHTGDSSKASASAPIETRCPGPSGATKITLEPDTDTHCRGIENKQRGRYHAQFSKYFANPTCTSRITRNWAKRADGPGRKSTKGTTTTLRDNRHGMVLCPLHLAQVHAGPGDLGVHAEGLFLLAVLLFVLRST